MTSTETIRNFLGKADRGDLDGALRHVTPDYRQLSPLGTFTDHDSVRALYLGFLAAFADNAHNIEGDYEAGDVGVCEGIWTGTHTGDLYLPDGTVVAPTGRRVESPFCVVGDVEAGLLKTLRVYFDVASFMAQLGLVPEPAAG